MEAGGEMSDAAVSDSEREQAGVELRPATPADADECGRIIYEAFAAIHDQHCFPRDFPTLEAATQLAAARLRHPLIWGVVAEIDGRIAGSNFLDERGPIRGVGPITVDPLLHDRGVGRQLMRAVLERGEGARGIRLVQDTFNRSSLALYASLGFRVREPMAVLGGRPRSGPAEGVEVRPLVEDDIESCEQLCLAVHAFDRTNEVRDALQLPVTHPFVAVRDRRIRAYATTLTFFPAAHAVAATEEDLRGLILGALAAHGDPASFLLPIRHDALFRSCLNEGLRIVKPMTYMTVGEYRDPDGWWIPSVSY